MARRRKGRSWRARAGLLATVLVLLVVAVSRLVGGDPAGPVAGDARASSEDAVARVIDGDTLTLESGTTVRLVQIDAPEVRGSECYANEATAALEELVPPGARVRVETDAALDREDRYGRRLAYVFKGDENVNKTLVERGAASVWFYDGDRGRYADELLAAAREAQAAERGLWGACEATLDPYSAITTGYGGEGFIPAEPVAER